MINTIDKFIEFECYAGVRKKRKYTDFLPLENILSISNLNKDYVLYYKWIDYVSNKTGYIEPVVTRRHVSITPECYEKVKKILEVKNV